MLKFKNKILKQKGEKMEKNGDELLLQDDSLITTKTDLRGFITYANFDFIQFSGFSEDELLGSNHNIVRHPDMPRVIFKILWQCIKGGREINAFVKNKNKQGYFYWVYANITPSFGHNGEIIGYYSVRRKPNRAAIPFIDNVYRDLRNVEREAKEQGKHDMVESEKVLAKTLLDLKMDHEVFFITLQKEGKV